MMMVIKQSTAARKARQQFYDGNDQYHAVSIATKHLGTIMAPRSSPSINLSLAKSSKLISK